MTRREDTRAGGEGARRGAGAARWRPSRVVPFGGRSPRREPLLGELEQGGRGEDAEGCRDEDDAETPRRAVAVESLEKPSSVKGCDGRSCEGARQGPRRERIVQMAWGTSSNVEGPTRIQTGVYEGEV